MRGSRVALWKLRDVVCGLQRELLSEKIRKLVSQVVDVALVDMSVFELVEDGKKESDGTYRHEGSGILRTEDASSGAKHQGSLHA